MKDETDGRGTVTVGQTFLVLEFRPQAVRPTAKAGTPAVDKIRAAVLPSSM